MVLGTFNIYDGDGIAYAITTEKAHTSYNDYFMNYMFNENGDIVGFVVFYDNHTLRDLHNWLVTLTSAHYKESRFSYIQKSVWNTENIHKPIGKVLVKEYNKNLDNIKLVGVE